MITVLCHYCRVKQVNEYYLIELTQGDVRYNSHATPRTRKRNCRSWRGVIVAGPMTYARAKREATEERKVNHAPCNQNRH